MLNTIQEKYKNPFLQIIKSLTLLVRGLINSYFENNGK
ncbi:hypothetical protein PROCH_1751 [Prochlorococcus marinus str. EQPAC1]|nr:hypothetical protein PROCH_1751 [Prochlorococcus marinus str. EQPAC1]